MEVFEECHEINDLIAQQRPTEARNKLIQLLDYHEKNQIQYSALVNRLIRDTGLYPYLDNENSSWQERFVYEAFKVDVGDVEAKTLHREQSVLLKKLLNGESIAVSAPTSFGKSFVIDAYISNRRPTNVVIIVPTIALTDETRRRIYKKFAHEYKIITTTDATLAQKNIFIFPQERAIHYVKQLEVIDLLIIDEFYKASSKFDRERSPSLIKAILKLGLVAKQKYFLAPNIKTLESSPFTEGMEFFHLDFNTVYLEQHHLYNEINKNEALKSAALLRVLEAKQTKTLIYAGTFPNIDSIATLFLGSLPEKDKKLPSLFANWLSEHYSLNWSLTRLIKRGVGIHNGRIHRSLSQIQVKLFEEQEGLDNIISTSSIIEGVNTSAENVVIWANRSGRGMARLDDFTFKNIIGRSGRMFHHFIGKIYILDPPPASEETKLEIPFPDEILGDLDEKKFERQLTKEQVAKIILYKQEMAELLGVAEFERIQTESVFQTSDMEVIKKIVLDMKQNTSQWHGLGYLNSTNADQWGRLLHKILNLQPGTWEARHTQVVEFIKILRYNWFKPIPELLRLLEPQEIGVDDFFKLERRVSFQLSALLKDVNTLQKVVLKDRNYDISRFISWCSHAFLPSVVYQMEEFGLPRMISKRIHSKGLIDFYDREMSIHDALDKFNKIGLQKMVSFLELKEFDRYILEYFFDGISTRVDG